MTQLRNKFKHWDDKEDLYLKSYYKEKTDLQLSKKLDRTEYSITNRRCRLGLTRHRPQSVRTIKEGMYERYQMIALNNKVEEMKYLIQLCQVEENNYRLEKYKAKLRKLSGL